MSGRQLYGILCISGLLVAGCHQAPLPTVPLRSVATMTTTVTATRHLLDLAGSVCARIESPLAFQISGRVVSRSVHLGESVRSGEILATLDTRDLQLELASAQAALTVAQANLTLAEADLHRADHLRGSDFVSAEEEEHRHLAVDAARAQLEQARNTLELRRNQLGYAVLKSPTAGVITHTPVESGQVVAAGEPVVQLAEAGGLDIEVVVPEDDLSLLHKTHASVSFWANPGNSYPVQLRELSASADPVTRTYTVRYAYNANAYSPALGQSAVIHLDRNQAIPVILVPSTALLYKENKTQIWVYHPNDQTVHLQPVTILDAVDTQVAISGISPGHVIVSQGVHVLVEGEKVTALPTAIPAATPLQD